MQTILRLIKGKRKAHYIPKDGSTPIQSRIRDGVEYVRVQFEITKEEREVASRLNRSASFHVAWVRRANLETITQ